jgi:hypothetical protein
MISPDFAVIRITADGKLLSVCVDRNRDFWTMLVLQLPERSFDSDDTILHGDFHAIHDRYRLFPNT